MKVLLGMSGGVDSSTSALILKNEGHSVSGLSLRLFEARGHKDDSGKSPVCCSLEAISDASHAAEAVGIAHDTLDARDLFVQCVVEPFARAYASGLTPNPCVLCNQHVKFPLLVKTARNNGFTHIATGHYATVGHVGGQATLQKGLDPRKDQSYFLYPIGRDTLDMTIFPLGSYTKDHVRQIAREAGLAVFNRPESQEICFVENDDYASTIRALIPDAQRPGPIIGPGNIKIGQHQGTINYTMGQRRRLGVSWSEPLYVTRIDAGANALHVGPRQETMQKRFVVNDVLWLTRSDAPHEPFRAGVKVRSTMQERPALITPQGGGSVLVQYDEPEFAPAPGQSAVFYDRDAVMGGGTIAGLPDSGQRDR